MRVSSRVLVIGVAAAGVVLVVTIGELVLAQVLKDSRFDVVSVSHSGPSSIRNGTSADYTVSVTIRRTGASAGQTIVGTSGTPRIRPALYSDGTQLTFQEIDFPPNVNSATVTLQLRCENNEVRGSVAGSGHGSRTHRPWWCLWLCTVADPAMVRGHLNERESTPAGVLCDP